MLHNGPAHMCPCLPLQISGGGDKLAMEKLVDAVAITIRLHSQVMPPAAGQPPGQANSSGDALAWRPI